jgi:hypothetical protein
MSAAEADKRHRITLGLTLPRCPCGNTKLRTYSTRPDPWGVTRWVVCPRCRQHFVFTVQFIDANLLANE